MSLDDNNRDGNGYPILFAIKAPGQVAAQTTSGARVQRSVRSGNSNADPASGRFTSGIRGAKQPSVDEIVNPVGTNRMGLPQGVSVEEWERRLDAIRDAAREFDEMEAGDAQDFLKGRVNDISKVDVDAFLADVREQRIDDLIDVLDYQLRSKVDGSRRARRFVRLQAPRGFVKRLFASLTDDEVLKVVVRLSNRGWGVDDLVDQVISRVNKQERKKAIEERLRAATGNQVKLDDWQGRFRPDLDGAEFEFDDEPQQVHIEMPKLPEQPTVVELADAMASIADRMPAPVINVQPQITVEAPKQVAKKVVRDEAGRVTGLEPTDG